MEAYVWLFPLLFIFHDMEEIIGFKSWIDKNCETIISRYPRIEKMYAQYSTEGMALAVFEEFILCIIICAISVMTNWYGLWLGGFIAFVIHLVVHIGQAIVIKKYIPALITSIICLPVSIYFIYRSISLLSYAVMSIVVFSFLGIIIIGINLKFAHFIMKKFTIGQER